VVKRKFDVIKMHGTTIKKKEKKKTRYWSTIPSKSFPVHDSPPVVINSLWSHTLMTCYYKAV